MSKNHFTRAGALSAGFFSVLSGSFLRSVYLLLFVSLVFSGCVVYRQSGRLNADQSAQIKKSPYSDLILEVKNSPEGYRQYGDFVFARKIRETGLFKEVLFDESSKFENVKFEKQSKSKADLVFELKNRGHRPYLCATGEVSLMILTLGLVPVYSDGNYDFIFKISSPENLKAVEREFSHTYINKVIVGWFSGLWGMSSGWTFSEKKALQESRDRLAYFLISMEPEINSLLSASKTS